MVHLFVFEIEPSWEKQVRPKPSVTFYTSKAARDFCNKLYFGDRSLWKPFNSSTIYDICHVCPQHAPSLDHGHVVGATAIRMVSDQRSPKRGPNYQLRPSPSHPLKPHTLPLTPLHLARNTNKRRERMTRWV